MRRKIQYLTGIYTSAVQKASLLAGVAAALMILVAVIVICQAVFVRYVAGGSSFWQTEFVTYVLIASTFLGSSYVLKTNGHVKVGLLSEKLAGQRQRVFRLAADAFSFIVFVVLAITAVALFHESWTHDWKSESLWGVSMWIPYGAMALGLVLLALQGLSELFEQWNRKF